MDVFELPRFEDRLWKELEGLHHEPELAPAPEEPHGRRRSRYLLVAAGLSAAACLGVGALVVNQGVDGDDGRAPSESMVSQQPAAEDGEAAIVVVERPDETTWTDEVTGKSRSASSTADSASGSFELADGSMLITEVAHVDHLARTYWVVAEDPGTPVATPMTDDVQRQIDEGYLTADGRETIDGRELLRYLGPPATTTVLCGIEGDPRGFTEAQCGDPGVERQTMRTAQLVTWLDPETGRRVQESADLDYDGEAESVITYEYLPRTPENLELLEVVVPEGYTEVPVDRPNAAELEPEE